MSCGHKSTVSAELPDYLLVSCELRKPSPLSHPSAKGQKSVLNQVSYDAPRSFLLPHIQPCSPQLRREIFPYSRPKTGRHSDHHRVFTYSDYSFNGPTEDYSSLPLGKGVDIEKGTDQGRRRKLPFYQVYEDAKDRKAFNLHLGEFTYLANQMVIGRADTTLKRSREATIRSTVRSRRTESSPDKDSPLNLTIATTRTEVLDRKAVSRLLRGKLSISRRKSTGWDSDYNAMEAMNLFDIKKQGFPQEYPVTRKTLGRIV